jgi:hypothetical protein
MLVTSHPGHQVPRPAPASGGFSVSRSQTYSQCRDTRSPGSTVPTIPTPSTDCTAVSVASGPRRGLVPSQFGDRLS